MEVNWVCILLTRLALHCFAYSEASIIGSFVWQTCLPNTNLAVKVTLTCACALEAQMLLADARIRPIAFVPLDQKHKYELLDSYLANMFAKQMATDTFLQLPRNENICKLNIMVISLRSIHRNAEKCI